MNLGSVFCITGIDTDIGKTIATGLLARGLYESGVNVITQKAVQTGCKDGSEDIIKHRELMGVDLFPEDLDGTTCPYLYSTPCSPHLAARIEKDTIDPKRIRRATERLQSQYDLVLLEGAGGLFVPLREDVTLIDFFKELSFPVILVTSTRLGSLNHTIASIEALHARDIQLAGVIYNRFGTVDNTIAEDSLYMISRYIRKYGYSCPIVEMLGEDFYKKKGSCLPFTVICNK